MIQEDKELLLKDLCSRLPYRTFVCLNPGAYNKPETCLLTGIHGEEVHLNVDSDPFRIDIIKPYLRPMSSMTDEERKEINKYYNFSDFGNITICYHMEGWWDNDTECSLKDYLYLINWLNKHHFDYRGLIEKGLALEASEGMYN